MAYQEDRPTFEEQGVTFELRKTTPRVVKKVRDIDIDELELGQQYVNLLHVIAEAKDGSIEDLDPEDIDIGKVNHYFEVFIKPLNVT